MFRNAMIIMSSLLFIGLAMIRVYLCSLKEHLTAHDALFMDAIHLMLKEENTDHIKTFGNLEMGLADE